MRLAVDAMRQSTTTAPKVGAVIVLGSTPIGVGHRSDGEHAERAAIAAVLASNADLRGAELYTTLEPCVRLDADRESCTELIIRVGITTVYIGRYDANPRIYRAGWRALRDAGVKLRDFEPDFRAEIDEMNRTFAEHFTSGVGPVGGAKFDYQLNRGNFEIRFSETDSRSIVTRWTHRGADSIYAYASRPAQVALARYAQEFDEIDDPTAYDFGHTVPVHVGEIAVFTTNDGAVLAKVLEVDSGHGSAATQRFVKIQYEVRARNG
jgi:diaminohydroxyphosphoribosylaminopyrimidine deaminase/5-amino-6-(5-phosphoribosylamino)uracil reductase